MISKAPTVAAYLAELPAERRAVVEAVRNVILKNLDKTFEEGIQYGMIGYYVPHSVYPAGYHCDPKQPLPFTGLAAQKNFYGLYMMCLYQSGGHRQWFETEWKKAGKKLDMGKACLRFKKLEDISLDLIGQAIARISAKEFISQYERAYIKPAQAKAAAKKKAGPAKKKAAKKAVKKTVTKKVVKKKVVKKTVKKAAKKK